MNWSEEHDASMVIRPNGIIVSFNLNSPTRAKPKEIFPTKEALAMFLDRLSHVYQGNNVSLELGQSTGPFSTYSVLLNITGRSPSGLLLIGEQFRGLPFILEEISLVPTKGLLDGKITLKVMGK